jgi:ABC-type bacteriocin/lantibiotic exporter with double-glycine peptidase domain
MSRHESGIETRIDSAIVHEDAPALDLDAERDIADSLEAPQGDRTVIIAHRSSTVRRCGRLVALRGGGVAAEGLLHGVTLAS